MSLFQLSRIFHDKKAKSITWPPKTAKLNNALMGFVFLTLCATIPLAILTFDISKSGVVGAIAIMPVLWWVIWFSLYCDHPKPASKSISWIFNGLAILTVMLGIANQLQPFPDYERPSNLKDLTTISKMHRDIADYATSHHWQTIILSNDRVIDFLHPALIRVTYYECCGKFIDSQPSSLGSGIFSTSKSEMLAALTSSNVVIFNISNNYPTESPYPADHSIAEFKPTLNQVVKKNFKPLGDYVIKNSTYRVYVKD